MTTRLCLDSKPLTSALFGLRAAAFSRIHPGGDGFAVRADARRGDLHAACAVTGSPPAGVHHIEQLPALAGCRPPHPLPYSA
ncbi:hypothetical protein [Streptomyces erythrochromogenes]|uniref:hypothetical protein n=1 Tax=Streptomyces erythrochromogenes TaxID=285574 RepID=UPI00386B0529|nr:hypothetical protein OG364_08190 [Streptomyces erythrochromogenes]